MADDRDERRPDRYDVILSAHARRALSETLPASVAFAVFEMIDGPLAADPHRVAAPLRATFDGYHRARRGPYRIRYRIDDDAGVVTVLDISHRRDAYRR
jgi:mRNA-degrading endonuclease RelE of RelBE toxin-antitoxin system